MNDNLKIILHSMTTFAKVSEIVFAFHKWMTQAKAESSVFLFVDNTQLMVNNVDTVKLWILLNKL